MVAALWWLLIVPIGLFTGVIVYLCVPFWITEMPSTLPKELLFDFISSLAYPRRVEQTQYLAAVLIPSILFLVFGIFHRKTVVVWAEKLRKWDRYFYTAVFVLQILLFTGVIRLWVTQEMHVYSYLGSGQLSQAIQISLFALVGIWAWQRSGKQIAPQNSWVKVVPYLIFFLFTSIQLMGSVFTDENLLLARSTIVSHMEHTLGEFTAVFYGKTPWVDYFPQYQVVLPYFVWPYFKMFGTSILSFTGLMSGLSFIGLFSLYWVLCRLTRKPWLALILIFPSIYFGFYSLLGGEAGAPNAFNYYAMWPLRYVMPCVTMALLIKALERLSLQFLIGTFCFGTLGAINNVDFGLPALVACFAAVIMTDLDLFCEKPKMLIQRLLTCFTGVIAGIFLFIMMTWVRSGKFPNPIQQFAFQKAFGLLGFGGSALPQEGAFQLVIFSFIACFFVGTYLGVLGKGTRVQKAVLVFNSVFGCGALMYFITRPNPENLQSFFVPWSFSVSVLQWQTLTGDGLKQVDWKQFHPSWLRVIPGLILLSHYFIFILTPSSKAMHSPILELARLQDSSLAFNQERLAQLKFIQERVSPFEKVSLMMPNAEWFAAQTHVKNVYMYGQLYSLFFKKQADQVIDHFLDEKVGKIFMVVLNVPEHFSELKNKLRQNHFEFKDRLAFRGWLFLEYWEKQKS